MMRPLFLLATLFAGTSSTASAQDIVPAQATAELDPCQLPLPHGTAPQAQALVRSACNEHRLWHSPFIDRQGRLARLPVTEAENSMLADDGLRAWQRVATYWIGSNTLHRTSAHPGSSACQSTSPASQATTVDSALCRSFVLDTPWSAAFISWLMMQAGVYDFPASAAHLDYIAASHQQRGPYRLSDPYQTRIRPGDLLCHLRGRSDNLDYQGLLTALSAGQTGGWQSHCDLVVASNPGGNRTSYAIGGNVLNAVTMRLLAVNERGALVTPAAGSPQDCAVQQPQLCSLNPPRWIALLQLRGPDPAPLAATTDTP